MSSRRIVTLSQEGTKLCRDLNKLLKPGVLYNSQEA